MLDTKKILCNGFKATGLYPFSPDSVDYFKLVKSSSTSIEIPTTIEKGENSLLSAIEKKIDPTTLQTFKLAEASGIWRGDVKHESLFYFWLSFINKASTINEEEVAVDTVPI